MVQRSEEFEQISNHTVALDPAGYLDRLSHLTAAGFCQVSQWETERSGYNRPSNALDARAKANGALWRSFQGPGVPESSRGYLPATLWRKLQTS